MLLDNSQTSNFTAKNWVKINELHRTYTPITKLNSNLQC